MLLPVVFVIVAALFATLAQRMGREMAALPPLRGYTLNLLGSLAGVGLFAVISWLQLSPTWWFGVGFAAAVPLLMSRRVRTAADRSRGQCARWRQHLLARADARPRPRDGARVAVVAVLQDHGRPGWRGHVVEVNNIFHQSMAPVEQKEYFYQWPYMVFGEHVRERARARRRLRHRRRRRAEARREARRRRRNRSGHRPPRPAVSPDHPYSDPRVTVVTDDARHFLRTTTKKYDLVVFALIDSLTMQSSFSGVRLESYMFTEESFRAVRDRLAPNGLLVVYNYFREQWLVDRLANIAANAFGQEPRVHVHEARAYLGVMMVGPRLATLTSDPVIPERVTAFGQSHAPSPARMHVRDAASSRRPTTGRSSISAIATSRRITLPRWRWFSSCRRSS